jgi:hypothetical protein
MKEKPVIFSAPMVRAILGGRKTQTRRVIKPQPVCDSLKLFEDGKYYHELFTMENERGEKRVVMHGGYKCSYSVGDLLWVREKFRLVDFSYVDDDWSASVQYAADQKTGARLHYLKNKGDEKTGWRSPIHMPKAAARLSLRVTGVRCERAQDITAEDVKAEGIDVNNDVPDGCPPDSDEHKSIKNRDKAFSKFLYGELWDKLNRERGYGWDANPWVWVVGFEREA